MCVCVRVCVLVERVGQRPCPTTALFVWRRMTTCARVCACVFEGSFGSYCQGQNELFISSVGGDTHASATVTRANTRSIQNMMFISGFSIELMDGVDLTVRLPSALEPHRPTRTPPHRFTFSPLASETHTFTI